MIDKLEVRLPSDVRFSSEVREFVGIGEFKKFGNRLGSSPHYQSVTDLRPIGVAAILHKGLRRPGTGYTGTHKLELLQVGPKSLTDWRRIIESVADVSPNDLRIMRLDTCADLIGTPVAWFLGRMRVKYKRMGRNIGDSQWQAISNRSLETLTAGARPNFIRVYDKVRERLQDYRKSQKHTKGLPPAKSFEELNGFPETATLTRVERQHSARGVPSLLASFGDLHRAADYNPFDGIEITDDTSPDDLLSRDDLSVGQTLEGIGAAFLKEKMGMQPFARWYNSKSNGNWSRFKKNSPHLFQSAEGSKMKQRIIEEWRKSTMQQLAV